MLNVMHAELNVSIPYRQATGGEDDVEYMIYASVSIPYRQATGCTMQSIQLHHIHIVSIPYRQATGDGEYLMGYEVHGVSIPYRQATGQGISQVQIAEIVGFQFLIGRLQAELLSWIQELDYRSFNSL